uniref:Uncharacterized protein n=1 Tax=Medicago truncatula TaxID=3880 RepID=I3SVG4_MEDTR|nr:unknown [Medicago truncatula]
MMDYFLSISILIVEQQATLLSHLAPWVIVFMNTCLKFGYKGIRLQL